MVVKMVDKYSSVEEVILDANLAPEDFGYDEEDNNLLEEKVLSWLVVAKDLIDSYGKRIVWDDLDIIIPATIGLASKQIAMNIAAFTQVRIETPIISEGEYQVQFTQDEVFTPAIKALIKQAQEAYLESISTKKTPLTLFRVRRTTEIEENEDEDPNDFWNWIA